MMVRASSILFLMVYFYVLFHLFLVNGDSEVCQGLCFCSGQEAVVDCSPQDRVKHIPTRLPLGTNKLFIQGGLFTKPGHLTRKNFTALYQLVSLKIVNSQIRSIESDALLDMKNLRHLDFSLNQLQRLERNTFNGLQLSYLYLQEQNLPGLGSDTQIKHPELILSDDVFNGLTARQINLFHNGISKISFKIFTKVKGLEKLILSGNKIAKLDRGFSEYFDHTDRLLDLTDNPLVCSCSIAWLADRVKSWILKLPSLNVTCISPEVSQIRHENILRQLNQIELKKLSAEHLCMTSRINALEVELSPSSSTAKIKCTAESYSDAQTSVFNKNVFAHMKEPSIAWKYIESGQLRQVSWMPHELLENQNSEENYSIKPLSRNSVSSVELNISLTDVDKELTCVTWDERGNSKDLLITIHGTKRTTNISLNNDGIEEKNENNGDTEKNPNLNSQFINEAKYMNDNNNALSFIYQKQYTIVELLCAVFGTFLSTVMILLIGIRCVKRKKSQFHQKTSQLVFVDSKDISTAQKNIKITENPNLPKMYERNFYKNGINKLDFEHLECGQSLTNVYDLNRTSPCPNYAQYHPFVAQNMLLSPSQFIPTNDANYRQFLPRSDTEPLLLGAPVPLQQIPSDYYPKHAQPVAFWSAATSSLYSPSGSQVYDIPRSMENSQIASFIPVSVNTVVNKSDDLAYDRSKSAAK